jgi:tetratricopeptide (TPR) repeat protein
MPSVPGRASAAARSCRLGIALTMLRAGGNVRLFLLERSIMPDAEPTSLRAPKVFISYSHDSEAHKARVRALTERLQADGMDCELDQFMLFPPEGWPEWGERKVKEADFVLIVFTERYAQVIANTITDDGGSGAYSEWKEIHRQLYKSRGVNTRFLPVVLDASDVPYITSWLFEYQYFCLVREEDYKKLCAVLRQESALGLSDAPFQKTNRFWFVPHPRNPYFMGRRSEMAALHKALRHGGRAGITQMQGISGLGGVGKTQTAVHYCYDHQTDYAAILWFSAESPEALAADVVGAARELALPEARDQEQTVVVGAFQRWLRTHQGWLVVLDNVDTPEMATACRDLLPTDAIGSVLVTSRLEDLTEVGIAAPLGIRTLPAADALRFFRERTRRHRLAAPEKKAAQELAKVLGYLPLALEQAAAYISVNKCNFSTYLKAFSQEGAKVLALSGVKAGIYPHTVATTWTMSLDRVARECPVAVALLKLCSQLAPEAIPMALVRKGGAKMGAAIARFLEDQGALGPDALLAPLVHYSLVNRNNNKDVFSMHRLVQAVTRASLGGEPERRQWAEAAVQALTAAFPDVTSVETWAECELCLPHVLACLTGAGTCDLRTPESASLLNKAGYYLDNRARFDEAEEVYQQTLAIREAQLGPKHPDVAHSLNNLAVLHYNQGRFAEAEPLLRRALSIMEEHFEPEHQEVAYGLSNLAAVLQAQGKLSEVTALYLRAMHILENKFGQASLELVDSLNNLALLYKEMGRHREAEDMLRRALAIDEEQQGANALAVAEDLNNLAMVCQEQDKLTEAEPLYQRALAIRTAVHEAKHPDIAQSLNNIGTLLYRQGRSSEAEPLLRRALDIRESVLGGMHPDVAQSLTNYAELLRGKGSHTEAEGLFRRALAISENGLGPDHRYVASILSNLSILLGEQGRCAEAEPLARRAVSIMETHQPDHPDTALLMESFADLLRKNNQENEACGLRTKAAAIRDAHARLNHLPPYDA